LHYFYWLKNVVSVRNEHLLPASLPLQLWNKIQDGSDPSATRRAASCGGSDKKQSYILLSIIYINIVLGLAPHQAALGLGVGSMNLGVSFNVGGKETPG